MGINFVGLCITFNSTSTAIIGILFFSHFKTPATWTLMFAIDFILKLFALHWIHEMFTCIFCFCSIAVENKMPHSEPVDS